MRGIMTHSLMSRGVSFEEAFRVANQVRQRLGERRVVTRDELAQTVREILGGELPGDDVGRGRFPVDIEVVGKGREIPFSKGILSQSLLAAAIDPSDAFDAARDLERQLVERGARRVDRRELRRLAYETLARTVGTGAAHRYLVWRKFQEPAQPVILLLGGAAGSGKTALAQEVAYRLGIPRVVSTDAIRQIMRLMLSQELMPFIHMSSYDAHQALDPDTRGDDPVIEAFRAQAGVIAVGVRALLDRSVAENTSMIVEGVSVVPGLVDVSAFEKTANVIFLVVATLNAEAYAKRFESRDEGAGARPRHRYLEHLDSILRIQDHLLEKAERHEVPIVDNESFDASVLSIIRHVTETLSKRHPFDVSELL